MRHFLFSMLCGVGACSGGSTVVDVTSGPSPDQPNVDPPPPAPPCIRVEPNVVVFGEYVLSDDVDALPQLTLTIENPCPGELEVAALDFASALNEAPVNFEVVDGPPVPFFVVGESERELTLRPVTENYGSFQDRLQILSNDPNFPEEVVAMTARPVCVSAELDFDSDGDGIPNDCDVCDGDDRRDLDGDEVPDACDACEGSDDRLDNDGDGVPDGCDDTP